MPVVGMDNLSNSEEFLFSHDKNKVSHTGILSVLNDSFTIKIPTTTDFYLISYGINNGDLLFEKNGEIIDFQSCSESRKKNCVCRLLEVFKVNDIDYNHNGCYLEDVKNDLSYDYESRDCYKAHDGGYMVHDNKNCYMKKLENKYKNFLSIHIPSSMIKILGKL